MVPSAWRWPSTSTIVPFWTRAHVMPSNLVFAVVVTFVPCTVNVRLYAAHGQNPTSNSSDVEFSDGTSTELATLAGDTTSGYTATITVGVSV
jgi:hypothetical protein